MHYTMYHDELLDHYSVPRKMGALVSKIACISLRYGEGIWCSNETLAKMINMSTRTITRWINRLVDLSVLSIKYLSAAKRYIFFTPEFAKDFSYVNGGVLQGYSVPDEFSKRYVWDNCCDAKSNYKSVNYSFKEDSDSVIMDKSPENNNNNLVYSDNYITRYINIKKEKEKRKKTSSFYEVKTTCFLSRKEKEKKSAKNSIKVSNLYLTTNFKNINKQLSERNLIDYQSFENLDNQTNEKHLSLNCLGHICSHINNKKNKDIKNNLDLNKVLEIEKGKEKEKSSAKKEKENPAMSERWARAQKMADEYFAKIEAEKAEIKQPEKMEEPKNEYSLNDIEILSAVAQREYNMLSKYFFGDEKERLLKVAKFFSQVTSDLDDETIENRAKETFFAWYDKAGLLTPEERKNRPNPFRRMFLRLNTQKAT